MRLTPEIARKSVVTSLAWCAWPGRGRLPARTPRRRKPAKPQLQKLPSRIPPSPTGTQLAAALPVRLKPGLDPCCWQENGASSPESRPTLGSDIDLRTRFRRTIEVQRCVRADLTCSRENEARANTEEEGPPNGTDARTELMPAARPFESIGSI